MKRFLQVILFVTASVAGVAPASVQWLALTTVRAQQSQVSCQRCCDRRVGDDIDPGIYGNVPRRGYESVIAITPKQCLVVADTGKRFRYLASTVNGGKLKRQYAGPELQKFTQRGVRVVILGTNATRAEGESALSSCQQ